MSVHLPSALLALSLLLAVLIGPHAHDWSWGPAALALGISLIAAAPRLGCGKTTGADTTSLTLVGASVVWLLGRAWTSPVREYAVTDSFLVMICAGAFLATRSVVAVPKTGNPLVHGIAFVALANLAVTALQFRWPGYIPFCAVPEGFNNKTGFFPHYNEAANFLIAVSMITGAHGILGEHRKWSRILLILIGAASLTMVAFTYSRGGMLGAVVGAVVFSLGCVFSLRQRSRRGFGLVAIVAPVLIVGLGLALVPAWSAIQEARGSIGDMEVLLDNSGRLYMAGVALSCISLHPFVGGGSWSYSWECFRLWDREAYGIMGARPDLVHNEFLQLATDYGIIGALLVAGTVGFIVILAVARLTMGREQEEGLRSRDAWLVGALAALAGMLTQSCFSFVFHLVPGVLLLGICLGALAAPRGVVVGIRRGSWWHALPCVPLLFLPGFGLITGGYACSRIAPDLWRVYLSKEDEVPAAESAGILAKVLERRPTAELHRERAIALSATEDQPGDPGFAEAAREAVVEFDNAIRLHPLEPSAWADSAELISLLGIAGDGSSDGEAERRFHEAIRLQGGLEACFQSRRLLAQHLFRKGLRLASTDPSASRRALEEAAVQARAARDESGGRGLGRPDFILVHEALGAAREATGDRSGALEAYDFASSLNGGSRAHYRAGVLIAKTARDDWAQRKPEKALAGFMKARARFYRAGPSPEGIDPALRKEQLDYIERNINLLRRAGIQASE